MSAKFLVTGDRGFIGSYLVQHLLDKGIEVVGIDNNSKYGEQAKPFDSHPLYKSYYDDVKDADFVSRILDNHRITHFVMGAAMIGGISYFHRLPFSLLAENERLIASQFGAVINQDYLERVVVVSSSMVYESCESFPTAEGDELTNPPPLSSYGFQKLATEYFARAAFDEHRIPYTIVRPFNCVGVGERRAKSAASNVKHGNIELAMSHVVPDLIHKIYKGQNPLHILGDGQQVRHYTYGGDLANGIITAALSPNAINEDFNISTDEALTVKEVAAKIYERIGGDEELEFFYEPPFKNDVRFRSPDVSKARKILGFEATTPFDVVLDEVIPWVIDAIKKGLM
jgi:UDP-glucose 4-epimerase